MRRKRSWIVSEYAGHATKDKKNRMKLQFWKEQKELKVCPVCYKEFEHLYLLHNLCGECQAVYNQFYSTCFYCGKEVLKSDLYDAMCFDCRSMLHYNARGSGSSYIVTNFPSPVTINSQTQELWTCQSCGSKFYVGSQIDYRLIQCVACGSPHIKRK